MATSKHVRTRQFFTLSASKFALHHTFNLSSDHTLCFSEPTFRPSGATNHWKNAVFRDFPTFTHLDLLSSDTFSLILFLLLFSSLLFSDSSHLCFSSVHIVGSLTSKLPSMIDLLLSCTYSSHVTTPKHRKHRKHVPSKSMQNQGNLAKCRECNLDCALDSCHCQASQTRGCADSA